MVGGGRRHRAAGPIPEGRPSGPRPSAVSRTTGFEAPRHSWPPDTPSRSFISFPSKFPGMFVLAFSCSLASLQRPPHFRAMPLTCISFTSSDSCFHSAPCFASPACIASSASSGMMLAMLGVLSSIRHPPKTLVFGLVFGCCGEMLQISLKPIRKSFAPYKGGPSIKRMRMFWSWSAHGRRHGARGLIPEGKPYRALACGPITSGGRIYTLTRHSRPPGTLPCPFCHVPFL